MTEWVPVGWVIRTPDEAFAIQLYKREFDPGFGWGVLNRYTSKEVKGDAPTLDEAKAAAEAAVARLRGGEQGEVGHG